MTFRRVSSATYRTAWQRVAFVGLLLLLAPAAPALEYPERAGNSDVVHLDGARADLQLRRWAMAQARHSIDYVAFTMSEDDVSSEFLREFRAASNRDLPVRVIVEQAGILVERDFLMRSLRYLTDSRLRRPARVICSRILPRWRAGLAWDDFIHEKVLIIDAGTPHEMIFYGGRWMMARDFHFFDSAFLLRPLDPEQPHVGRDIVAAYERLWRLLEPVMGLQEIRSAPRYVDQRMRREPVSFLRDAEDEAEYAALRAIAERRPRAGETLAPNQFRPETFRYLTNDLYENALRLPSDGSVRGRGEFPNDIVRHTVELLGRTGAGDRVDLAAYSIAFLPQTRAAVLAAVERGAHVNLLTNGRESHGFVAPTGLTVHYTYRELIPLLQATARMPGQLRLHALDQHHVRRATSPTWRDMRYVHMKMLILLDWILTGSDNFTPSSARKNDESMLRMRCAPLADYLRARLQAHIELFHVRDLADIEERYSRRPFYFRACSPLIERLW